MKGDPKRSRVRGEGDDAGGARHADAAPHRKALTRQRILEAAVELFAGRGYERTTVALVASHAGVSPAAIHWHFGDKATLFRQAFAQLLVPFRDAFETRVDHLEPAKRLSEMFETYERFVVQHRDTIQSFLRLMVEAAEFRPTLRDGLMGLHDRFAEDVHAALLELLPPGHDARALASGLLALLDGNLVLGLVESETAREARRAGLRAVLALIPAKTPEEKP